MVLKLTGKLTVCKARSYTVLEITLAHNYWEDSKKVQQLIANVESVWELWKQLFHRYNEKSTGNNCWLQCLEYSYTGHCEAKLVLWIG